MDTPQEKYPFRNRKKGTRGHPRVKSEKGTGKRGRLSEGKKKKSGASHGISATGRVRVFFTEGKREKVGVRARARKDGGGSQKKGGTASAFVREEGGGATFLLGSKTLVNFSGKKVDREREKRAVEQEK